LKVLCGFVKSNVCEGVASNKPRFFFCGENYPFSKVQMQIFLEYIDRGIWDVILNGSFVPVHVINNMQEERYFSLRIADQTRKSQYDDNFNNNAVWYFIKWSQANRRSTWRIVCLELVCWCVDDSCACITNQ